MAGTARAILEDMAHINRTNRTATLTLAESMVLASAHTPDGRELDRVRRQVRDEVGRVADELRLPIEVYACQRHGGHLWDVVYPAD